MLRAKRHDPPTMKRKNYIDASIIFISVCPTLLTTAKYKIDDKNRTKKLVYSKTAIRTLGIFYFFGPTNFQKHLKTVTKSSEKKIVTFFSIFYSFKNVSQLFGLKYQDGSF